MRNAIRAMVTAVILSVASFSAYAQTKEQAANLEVFLSRICDELDKIAKNLGDIGFALQPDEGEFPMRISDNFTNVSKELDTLSMVAAMYSLMIDHRDQMTVKRYFLILAKLQVRSIERVTQSTDRRLAYMKSSAAIEESKKGVELIQKVRREVQRTVPGS